MKKTLFIITLLVAYTSWSQNVQVDAQAYTPQQLIEDILIDSNCITNVVVTNVEGGNFNSNERSYGYFDASGSSFPFQNGLVLTTGRLDNVPGPNTTLSDDDAPNWEGDNDLETVLNESNTTNATIIEFNFEAIANQISFRYIFASEEYQEGNSNTCQYSDLFGFLIRPENQQGYTNIALVPNTQTPVKVTTVHSGIPGSCNPINEQYFGSWNDATAPINFNGQTAILTATADVVPNTTYHVKLVIADEQNYRYDSAVFLEAGSFKLQTNLGPDRLIANNNALCVNETTTLDATQPGNNTYRWFRNGTELLTETNATLTVTQAGTYTVEVTIDGTCLSTGSIIIEYSANPTVSNTSLIACDYDMDGLTTYNLLDAIPNLTTENPQDVTISFYTSQTGAEGSDLGLITEPENFNNSLPQETVYARVQNMNGCISVAEILLDTSNNTVVLPAFETCDTAPFDGITNIDLNAVETFILNQNTVPNSGNVRFYASQTDLENQSNELTGSYENTNSPYTDTLFVNITDNGSCFAYTSITISVLNAPELEPDSTEAYCLNKYPNTILINSGVIQNPNNFTYAWDFNGVDMNLSTHQIAINEPGNYTVFVTNTSQCTASRTITVQASEIATINSIDITETTTTNSITINISGSGVYEFALNDGVYQTSNTFSNLAAGFYTVSVRDINLCGTVSDNVAILGFPKYFTPNNDGQNDTWQPIAANSQIKSLRVFDRYGKLIKDLNAATNSWDGTYNGRQLPSDDFWYVAVLIDGKIYRGHFALVR